MLDEKQTETLNIGKNRTLLGLFRDFIEYLKMDGNLLFKSLCLFSFSLLILSFVASGYFLDNIPRVENVYYLKNHLSKPLYVFLVSTVITFVASLCAFTWVVNRVMLLRDENKSEPSRILYSVFKKSFSKGLSSYVFNFLILYVTYLAFNYLSNFLRKTIVFADNGSLDVYPLNDLMNCIMGFIIPAVLMPPLFYFGFAALYSSVRDEIGISDAVKKIYEVSSGKMKTIWLQSTSILLVVALSDAILQELMRMIFRILPLPDVAFLIVVTGKTLLSFCIVALAQVMAILLFGSIEISPKTELELQQN